MEEQELLSMKEQDFERCRKTNVLKYRAMLRQYVKLYQPSNLEEAALSIIKKQEERNEEEICILQQWTNRFKFFQELNSKQLNLDLKLHHKCCAKMKYEKISKGMPVFMAGDLPEKFYIVLSGAVNVMLGKSADQLKLEIAEENKKQKGLRGLELKQSISYKIAQIKQNRENRLNGNTCPSPTSQDLKRRSKYSDGLSPAPGTARDRNIPSLLGGASPSHIAGLQQQNRRESHFKSPQTPTSFSKFLTNNGGQSVKKNTNGNTVNQSTFHDPSAVQRKSSRHGSFSRIVSPLVNSNNQNNGPDSKRVSAIGSQQALGESMASVNIEEEENDEDMQGGDGESDKMLEKNEIRRMSEKDIAYKLLGDIPLESIQNLDKFFIEGVPKFKYLLTLPPGAMFGELGLLLKKPRAATILAKEDCEFAVLNAVDYSRILSVGEMKQMNERILFFSENFLQGCGREIVTKYSYNFECRKFQLGNVIYSQGDSSNYVYIIKKGLVELSETIEVYDEEKNVEKADTQKGVLKALHDKEQSQCVRRIAKKNVKLSVLSSGQCFGEIEILKNTGRLTHAISASLKLTLLVLPANIFGKLISENKFLMSSFRRQIGLKEFWYERQERGHELSAGILAGEIKANNESSIANNQADCVSETEQEICTRVRGELAGIEVISKNGGAELVRQNQLLKTLQLGTLNKQIQFNYLVTKNNQEPQQSFDQQVFKVMREIQQQRNDMRRLLKRILTKNAANHLPKNRIHKSFSGQDIKYSLDLQLAVEMLQKDFKMEQKQEKKDTIKQGGCFTEQLPMFEKDKTTCTTARSLYGSASFKEVASIYYPFLEAKQGQKRRQRNRIVMEKEKQEDLNLTETLFFSSRQARITTNRASTSESGVSSSKNSPIRQLEDIKEKRQNKNSPEVRKIEDKNGQLLSEEDQTEIQESANSNKTARTHAVSPIFSISDPFFCKSQSNKHLEKIIQNNQMAFQDKQSINSQTQQAIEFLQLDQKKKLTSSEFLPPFSPSQYLHTSHSQVALLYAQLQQKDQLNYHQYNISEIQNQRSNTSIQAKDKSHLHNSAEQSQEKEFSPPRNRNQSMESQDSIQENTIENCSKTRNKMQQKHARIVNNFYVRRQQQQINYQSTQFKFAKESGVQNDSDPNFQHTSSLSRYSDGAVFAYDTKNQSIRSNSQSASSYPLSQSTTVPQYLDTSAVSQMQFPNIFQEEIFSGEKQQALKQQKSLVLQSPSIDSSKSIYPSLYSSFQGSPKQQKQSQQFRNSCITSNINPQNNKNNNTNSTEWNNSSAAGSINMNTIEEQTNYDFSNSGNGSSNRNSLVRLGSLSPNTKQISTIYKPRQAVNKKQTLLTSISIGLDANMLNQDTFDPRSLLDALQRQKFQGKESVIHKITKNETKESKISLIKKELQDFAHIKTENSCVSVSSPKAAALRGETAVGKRERTNLETKESNCFSSSKQRNDLQTKQSEESRKYNKSPNEKDTIEIQSNTQQKQNQYEQLMMSPSKQKGFLQTRHSLFRAKPDKLFLLHNSQTYLLRQAK